MTVPDALRDPDRLAPGAAAPLRPGLPGRDQRPEAGRGRRSRSSWSSRSRWRSRSAPSSRGRRAGWNKLLEDARGEAGRLRNEADGYYQTKTNQAKAVVAVAQAEAEGIRKEAEALGKMGGDAYVKMQVAKQFAQKKILIVPGSNVSTMNVNELVDYLVGRAARPSGGAASCGAAGARRSAARKEVGGRADGLAEGEARLARSERCYRSWRSTSARSRDSTSSPTSSPSTR